VNAAAAAGEVLRVRGRPDRLSGTFRAPAAAPRVATVRVAALPGANGPADLRARIRPELGDGLSTLRLTLAPTTPPGTYESVLRVGGQERAVVIEVEPYPRTRLAVPRGEVAGKPGTERTLKTTVMNVGNVALDVPESADVRFTDTDLVDAVLTAVSAKTDSDERLRAFADGLAGADGGTVALEVAEGAGALEPGGVRDLTLRLRVPEGLVAGRTYAGTWALGEARFTIVLAPEEEEVVG
jgi:hypothetical protein